MARHRTRRKGRKGRRRRKLTKAQRRRISIRNLKKAHAARRGRRRKGGKKRRRRNRSRKRGRRLTKAQRRAIAMRNLGKAHRGRRRGKRRSSRRRSNGGLSNKSQQIYQQLINRGRTPQQAHKVAARIDRMRTGKVKRYFEREAKQAHTATQLSNLFAGFGSAGHLASQSR